MALTCKNVYKIARELADFTQEQAGKKLFISVRLLSEYENGHTPVPSEILEKMIDVYEQPSLWFWHIQLVDPLGRKCLANQIYRAETNRELAFTSDVNSEKYMESSKIIRKIMSNGEVNDDEMEEFTEWIDTQKTIASQILNNLAFAQLIQQDKLKGKNGELTKKFVRICK